MVEQWIENPRVVGSIPTGGTKYADVAHLVERHLAKVEVASSSLVIRSIKKDLQKQVLDFLYCKTTRQTRGYFYALKVILSVFKLLLLVTAPETSASVGNMNCVCIGLSVADGNTVNVAKIIISVSFNRD